MSTKPPFFLVPDDLPTETIALLERLLDMAKRRELIGLAFAAMFMDRNYIVNAAGEAHRNPTFSRGMCAALDDQLAKRVRRKKR